MATFHKAVLNTVPGLQSMALVGENLKLMPKISKKGKVKAATPKKFLKTGVTTMTGIGMIGATSKMIGAID